MALQGSITLLTSKLDLPDSSSIHLKRMGEQIERIKKLTHKNMHITKYETKNYAGGKKIIDLDQASKE